VVDGWWVVGGGGEVVDHCCSSVNHAQRGDLLVTVWDKEKLFKDGFLGLVRLKLASLGTKRHHHW